MTHKLADTNVNRPPTLHWCNTIIYLIATRIIFYLFNTTYRCSRYTKYVRGTAVDRFEGPSAHFFFFRDFNRQVVYIFIYILEHITYLYHACYYINNDQTTPKMHYRQGGYCSSVNYYCPSVKYKKNREKGVVCRWFF